MSRNSAAESQTTKEQKHIHDLAWRCIKFVDSNPPSSKILDRGSNPFSSYLRMSYKGKDMFIEFRVQSSPYSNGSSHVLVKFKGKRVFEAKGNFIATIGNMVADIYVPGDWEKKIPKVKDSL